MNHTPMKHLIFGILSSVLALLLGFGPAFAADSGTTSAPTALSQKDTAAMARMKARGDQELDRRIVSLNKLVGRVAEMKNLSPTDKAAVSTTLNAQITALTALKAKIDADTDLATLKTDVQSVTASYRIYALVIPQGTIIAAADRIVTVVSEMQSISAKLKTRITAAAAAGDDVGSLQTLLTDYDAKIADALAQAQAAVNGIVTLVPDGGDKTKQAANTAALQAARAKIVTAQHDVNAARKDGEKIRVGLRDMKSDTKTLNASTTESH